MELTTRPIRFGSADDRQAAKLLKAVFPKKEQMSLFLLHIGTLRKDIHFTAFYDREEFVGLLYSIENAAYYFILYLAVDPTLQSKGFGGSILDYAYRQAGKRSIILNIEAPDPTADNCVQRQRRITFYARHGICETGYGFTMDGMTYSVLASESSAFDPKAYSDMLGGISLGTKSTSQERLF